MRSSLRGKPRGQRNASLKRTTTTTVQVTANPSPSGRGLAHLAQFHPPRQGLRVHQREEGQPRFSAVLRLRLPRRLGGPEMHHHPFGRREIVCTTVARTVHLSLYGVEV